MAAQIGAVDNLIAAGYDGIIINAVNPTSFGPVIKRANRAGTVLVSFDNAIDSKDIIVVNEPQIEFEKVKAQFVYDNLETKTGKVLEVRGLPGNSVDRDRSAAMHMVFDNQPGIEVVTVVGNWDDGTTQKVVSDAIATYGNFIGIVAQHASTGLLNALNDAKHPEDPARHLRRERVAQDDPRRWLDRDRPRSDALHGRRGDAGRDRGASG